jgi:putative peptide zinc metalloprotease protein
MVDSLQNPHWYRIADLKPKLHAHLEIHRHDYRGLIWYIIEDTINDRNHRFNPAAYQFIGLLDGKHSVQQISAILVKQLGDFAPTQDEIIQLMGQLYSADLIKTDALINIEELFDRQSRLSQAKFSRQLINPLSQKLPLWDPDDFLEKHLSKVTWLIKPWMAVIWILVVVNSLLQAGANWEKIQQYFDINALTPYNFLVIFFIYPVIKILHELGHAFTTKLKGGDVHEMGVNFMLFVPVPYVNVSSSGKFRNKYDRMLVSSAGILVEVFLAALSLLLFLSTQSGVLQNIGFNIFVIGGVSSLFFNGNPLLKYDGYYILADALGIPNLFQRSGHYWRYFFQRYLFGLTQAVSPVTTSGETFWFVVYSISSLLYRLGILWFICVYVTDKFFSIGVLLAFWLVTIQIIFPIYKALSFVLKSPTLRKKRNRAAMATASIVLVTFGLFGFMPIPSYTLTEGVVWLPDEALIKAEYDGFIDEIKFKSNEVVKKGDIVARLSDDMLETKARITRAKLNELQSQFRAERETNLVKADIIKEEYRITQSELENLDNKIKTLTIKAAKDGHIFLPEADDLPNKYVHHGEALGYILDGQPPTIRMAVTQDNIGQLREHIADIKVRLCNRPDEVLDAAVIRAKPEATNKLFSAALATIGGGKIQVDPNQKKELVTLEKVFWVDLKFAPKDKNLPLGARVFVRIKHGDEAILKQWYRRIRQAFLRQFNA